MIEQTKFTYLLLGKALEKQTKAIENPGEKQIKAFAKHGKQLIMSSSEKESFWWKTEIFDEFVTERRFEIIKSSEGIDFDNLTYHYKAKVLQNSSSYLKVH